MMQEIEAKQAEIVFRRNHYWNAADSVGHFRRSLDSRRAFFAAAVQAGRIKPPILEIGAEYGVNGMLLEDELGLPTVCLDLSLRALQAADVVARYFGKQPCEWRVAGDGERLPFAAGSFATVLLWGTLHHFSNVTRLLSEIRRVLVADGRLIVAEEPIRRAWRLPLFRTASGDRLRGVSRLLLKAGMLPYFARIGGRTETTRGIVEREFRIDDLQRFFAAFHSPEWFFEPQLTGGVPAAGPLVRWWWSLGELDSAAKKKAVRRYGGAAYGWLTKPAALRDLGGGRYLVQKHPRHDRLTIHGFQGAMMCNGEPLTADDETVELPPSTLGRTHLLLDIPRYFLRLDLWSTEGEAGLVTRFTAETPPDKAVWRLACPDCLVFTERCIYGACKQECVQAAAPDYLDPTDPRRPFKRLDYDYEVCLHACPHGGLDRPLLKDGRCPECRRLFSRNADVLDCRPKRLDDSIGLRELESSARF